MKPSVAHFRLMERFCRFSSFSLVNTGTTLVLRDAQDAIIHHVSYTDSWYQNSIKQNGGWSLEMIDPQNPCAGAR